MAAPAYHTRVLLTRRAGAPGAGGTTDADAGAIAACLDVDERAPAPRPAPGQLLVRVTARPIHPADIMAIQARPRGAKASACASAHKRIALSR
jgi:hypothetical protein